MLVPDCVRRCRSMFIPLEKPRVSEWSEARGLLFTGPAAARLPAQAQGELQDAGGVGRGDGAVISVAGVGVWGSEVGVVEDVKRFPAELKRENLRQHGPFFVQADVGVELRGAATDVAGGVAVWIRVIGRKGDRSLVEPVVGLASGGWRH